MTRTTLAIDRVDLDPVPLARLQFAFTIVFHIIFPTITIGSSAYIATLCVVAAIEADIDLAAYEPRGVPPSRNWLAIRHGMTDLIPREMITAYAILKKAAAIANHDSKRLDGLQVN
jgi:hypothetical protein